MNGHPSLSSQYVPKFLHQIGGHNDDALSLRHCVTTCRIFKPLQNNGRGQHEVSFYLQLEKSLLPIDLFLLSILPTFYGTTEIFILEKEITCLALQDVTNGIKRPHIMDIKMGTKTVRIN